MSEPFSADDAVALDRRRAAARRGATRVRAASRSTGATVRPGELFVAIAGRATTATPSSRDAVARGRGGRRWSTRRRTAPDAGAACAIAVDDTTRALGALAAGHRAPLAGPLVAITGSNGKTTTKEMCAAILAVRRRCLKTAGNLNNEFGAAAHAARRGADARERRGRDRHEPPRRDRAARGDRAAARRRDHATRHRAHRAPRLARRDRAREGRPRSPRSTPERPPC